jgi:putative DNA methylase
MSHSIISPKKLIEVALPLDAINAASIREGYIYRGNPSAIHKWWAQRPLAAARAVIFSQLVLDPEDLWRCQNPHTAPNAQVRGHWTKARGRLFRIIEELVLWENTTNDAVLEKARDEIRKSWRDICELNKSHPRASDLFDPNRMPGLHDPFAGGGTIPLEAQRLGLDSYASDLNPVAVMINKATIEIPQLFCDRAPVNPRAQSDKNKPLKIWDGTNGLADDIRYYGQWVRDQAAKQLQTIYPSLSVTEAIAKKQPELEADEGKSLPILAWLWARTIRSPNPAFSHIEVPLASTFVIRSKPGRELYVEPTIVNDGYYFEVKSGKPTSEAKSGTKASRGANFRCLMSGVAIDPEYIKSEASQGRMSAKLMAIVVQASSGRTYLSATNCSESAILDALSKVETAAIEVPIANDPRPMTCLLYGMKRFDDIFLPRQLAALCTFSDLIRSVRGMIETSAIDAGMIDDRRGIEDQGRGAAAYADAICTYLAFSLDKAAEYNCSLVAWNSKEDRPKSLFTRQAIPILWDFVEVNPLGSIGGTFEASVNIIAGALAGCSAKAIPGHAFQANAVNVSTTSDPIFVSTDPPYYDNIGYADLSDFFYVWIRRTLRCIYPSLMATISVPKDEELVATLFRHGSKDRAEQFFLDGMTSALRGLAQRAHPGAPITIYYAFKQSETSSSEGTSSTGWVAFLDSVMKSGLTLTGTWPLRTERAGRMRDTGSNALASSILLVCRPRSDVATVCSRRQFVRELNATLPAALDAMTRESEGLHSPVAPVDLSQAIIGPGMAVFSKYSDVLEADGSRMSVRTALQLINRFLAEDDFDADTQFCLHWFEQHKWEAGKFGEADVLARSKGTYVEGVKQSGVIRAAGGVVRLLKWPEYSANWEPSSDRRLNVWEVLHQLIRVFGRTGESGAALVLATVVSISEPARQLAYRLYTLCERAGLAEDARSYNDLITSWSAIESAASRVASPTQRTLFE